MPGHLSVCKQQKADDKPALSRPDRTNNLNWHNKAEESFRIRLCPQLQHAAESTTPYPSSLAPGTGRNVTDSLVYGFGPFGPGLCLTTHFITISIRTWSFWSVPGSNCTTDVCHQWHRCQCCYSIDGHNITAATILKYGPDWTWTWTSFQCHMEQWLGHQAISLFSSWLNLILLIHNSINNWHCLKELYSTQQQRALQPEPPYSNGIGWWQL